MARRLESVLAELDELEAWREAAEISSALEHLHARIVSERAELLAIFPRRAKTIGK